MDSPPRVVSEIWWKSRKRGRRIDQATSPIIRPENPLDLKRLQITLPKSTVDRLGTIGQQ